MAVMLSGNRTDMVGFMRTKSYCLHGRGKPSISLRPFTM